MAYSISQREMRLQSCARRRLYVGAATLLLFLPAASVANATIATTGNVSPLYPGNSPDPWNVAGELLVGNSASGSLTVSGGSDVSSNGGTAGFDPLVTGTISIAGSGSSWTNSGNLFLGIFGIGKLEVASGARVDNAAASLGNLNGFGQVAVQGSGSQWVSSGLVTLGVSGHGEMVISNQGYARSANARLGLNESATGLVTIDGAQSTWEIDQALILGDAASGGDGALELTGGGSRLYLGGGAAAFGAGLPTNESAIVISKTGNAAKLTIYDANSVQNIGSAYIGVGTGQTGEARIEGANARWQNAGSVTIGAGGIGTLLLRGGELTAGGGTSLGSQGTLNGVGTVTGSLANGGTLEPGSATGTLAITGNYTQAQAGELGLKLGGADSGQFSRLDITGSAILAGTLSAELISIGGPSYAPQLGDALTVLTATGGLSGNFTTAVLPQLPSGRMWHLEYSAMSVTLSVHIAGDYNANGVVDAADYTVWRNALGTNSPQADGDTNGTVDAADLTVWKTSFGAISGVGSGGTAARAIPEPGSGILLASLIAMLASAARSR